jgi:hypothetical protein
MLYGYYSQANKSHFDEADLKPSQKKNSKFLVAKFVNLLFVG